MKVPINFILISFLFISTLRAQKIPKYNPTDFLEIGWKTEDCNFDPEADAIILFKENTYDFIMSTNTMFMDVRYKRLIKVFNQDGLEHVTHEHRFNSFKNSESIKFVNGTVYNKDENGNVIEQAITKENVFVTPQTEIHSIFKIAPPNVKEGSIVYIEYTLRTPYFLKHYYQETIPIVKSIMNSSFENDLQINLSNAIYQQHKKVEEYRGGRKYYFVELDSVIGLSSEPYQHNRHLYYQKANMVPTFYGTQRLLPDMGNVIYAYLADDDFRRKLNSDVTNNETELLLAEVKTLSSDLEKADKIYRFVRDNFESTSSSNIYLDNTLASVLRNKKGSEPELSALLYKLLQKAGLKANIILTNTNTERPFEQDWPSINDFSSILIKLFIGKDEYILSPFYKALPFGFIPRNYIHSSGLHITDTRTNKATYEYVFIENKKGRDFKITNAITELTDDGKIKGKAITNYLEYANTDFTFQIRKDSSAHIKKIKDENILDDILDINIARNSETNSTLSFNFEKELSSQDGFVFLPINIFTDHYRNPFITPYRKTGIFYSAPITRRLNLTINLSDQWEIESLPQNGRFTNEDKSISFTRRLAKEENRLSIQLEITISKTLFDSGEYEMFYEFWNLIYENLNENIVIKKK